MTYPLRVRIGDWIAAGADDDLVNGEGFIIAPDGFQGWDDGVDMRREVVQRSRAAGDFETQGFPDSRVVTLSGSCWAETAVKLDWFKKQLTGLLADGNAEKVIVDHQGGTLFGRAARVGKPTFRVSPADEQDALWQLQLWFPDPRKYGEERVVGPSLAVTSVQHGNADAYPVITVAGNMPTGYHISGPTGGVFIVTEPVTSGHPHTIDMATGYLWQDGVIVYGKVTSGPTWSVAPGMLAEHGLAPSSGTGTITVRVRDTFL